MTLARTLMLAVFCLMLPRGAVGLERYVVMEGGGLTVLYEEPSEEAARILVEAYPEMKAELLETIGPEFSLDREPTVLLSLDFERLSGGGPIVAYARADERLIVMDISHAFKGPLELSTTFKHELSHLMLGVSIPRGELPRWLDEGVAQWASGGVSELLLAGEPTALSRAARAGSLIPLRRLARSFPREDRALHLAYEQSKSVVEYIVREHGRSGLLDLLHRLKEGEALRAAVSGSLTMDLREFETRWEEHLLRRHTWFTYLSDNLYVVLFVLASAVTLLGFLRFMMRLRRAVREDDEGPAPGGHFPAGAGTRRLMRLRRRSRDESDDAGGKN